jgi:hypothetical protein
MEKKTQKCSGNTKPRTRTWAITVWTEPTFNEKQMSYLVTGKEVCPKTQREHWQTYVRYHNAKTFEQVKKQFGNEAHVESTKGTPDENISYCTKDGDYKEYGKPS